MKRNIEIREAAIKAGVKFWEIAERYGCTDGNFSRKLRAEFSPKEKRTVLNIINELKKDRE